MRERLEQMTRYIVNKYENYKRFRPQFFGWEFFVPEDREHINWREWPYQKITIEEDESLNVDFKAEGEESGRIGEKYVLLLEMKPGASITWGSKIYWPKDYGAYSESSYGSSDEGKKTVYTYIGFICMKRDDEIVYDVLAISDNLEEINE